MHLAIGAAAGSRRPNALKMVEDAGVTLDITGVLGVHVIRAALYLWPLQREEFLVVSVQTVQVINLCMVFLGCMAAFAMTAIITDIIGLLLFLVFLIIVNVVYRILLTLVTDVAVEHKTDITHFLVKVEQEPMLWEEPQTVKATTVELVGSECDITTALKK